MKIQNKSDYLYFIKADRNSFFLGKEPSKKQLLFNPIWKFQKLLRKCEYLKNTGKKARYYLARFRCIRLGIKLGFNIPCNVFGPGLRIAHYGSVVVNSYSQIGSNCTIHSCVNIGSNANDCDAPIIGNNVYLGPGAKISGKVVIGDNTKIGANAVVNKSFPEGNCTLVGVPAKAVNKKCGEGLEELKAID